MHEFILHASESLPSELILPFSWRKAQSEPNSGDLGFYNNSLCVFDQERWVSFDLGKTLASLRPSPGGISKDPLARALGLIKKTCSRVIDASCGTGKDSLQVWQTGIPVLAFERHPLVYALLWDALRRHPLPNFELRFGDASLEKFLPGDAIMFDPMFEQVEKKKSLARKEMQLFKNFVGLDHDQEEAFRRLIQSGAGRVVVKRPLRIKSEVIPNHSFEGKTIRFDVYLA